MLRRALFLLLFLLAQWSAAAHAIEHGAAKEGALPQHACELCLVAHNLGAGAATVLSLPVIPAAPPPSFVYCLPAAPHLVLPEHRQGAPPT